MKINVTASVARRLAVAGLLATGSIAQAQSVTSLYTNNCVTCHADDGSGGGAGTQSLLRPEAHGLKGPTDRAFFEAIRNGLEGTAMPAYGGDKGPLSDAQVWGLVNRVRELQERGRRAQEKAPHKRAVDGVITSQHGKYRIETVVSEGLDTPWGVDFLPPVNPAQKDDISAYAMLITEKSGGLRVYANGTLSKPVTGLPKVYSRGQGGLMDVCVDPDYASNRWIYLSYSEPGPEGAAKNAGMTTIVRGKLVAAADGGWMWTDMQTLWRPKTEHYVSGDVHFGNRIVIDKPIADGPDKGKRHLYFCIGERGRADTAQDMVRPNGKVHRIFTDGTVPGDNPFADAASQAKGIYASTWSYGHRNPQGLVMDAKGRLWDTEHGPRGGDELNLVQKGRNFGWPLVTAGINYNDTIWGVPWPDVAAMNEKNAPAGGGVLSKNIAMPAYVWTPSIAACGLAVAEGGAAGEAFPQWKGDLFAGGLAGQVVERLRMSEASAAGEATVLEREEIIRGMGRVRDVFCGPDGAIYVALNDPDRVVRVSGVK